MLCLHLQCSLCSLLLALLPLYGQPSDFSVPLNPEHDGVSDPSSSVQRESSVLSVLCPVAEGWNLMSRQSCAPEPGKRHGSQIPEYSRFLLRLSQSLAALSSEIPEPRKTGGLMEEREELRHQERLCPSPLKTFMRSPTWTPQD